MYIFNRVITNYTAIGKQTFPFIIFSTIVSTKNKQTICLKSSFLILPFVLMGLIILFVHIKYYIFSSH